MRTREQQRVNDRAEMVRIQPHKFGEYESYRLQLEKEELAAKRRKKIMYEHVSGPSKGKVYCA